MRERDAEREHGGTMRKRGERDHGPDYRKKREVGPRESVQVRLARTASAALLDSREILDFSFSILLRHEHIQPKHHD